MPGLAARLRAKYPGSYDDMDDASLEKAVIAKHPEYADLATKPQTSMSTAELQAANAANRDDLPSTAGFLGNALTSGANFAGDLVKGAAGIAKFAGKAAASYVVPELRNSMIQEGGEMVMKAPQIAGALKDAAKARYGSVDNALHTGYTDPVGVASDVATVAGGVGAVAKAGGASKLARLAAGVERVANPMSIVGAIAEPVAHGAANAAVRATLRAPASVRDEFGGGKAVADAVLKDRVFSEANAQKKLTASVSQADKLIADAEAAGVSGIKRVDVARAPLAEPLATAKLRQKVGSVGAADEAKGLDATAKAIFKNNPHEIPLTEAQAMKREAQGLAHEAGRNNQTVAKAGQKATAAALRKGIEARVPAVGPVNEKSQRLIGTKEAFSAAQDRPNSLTNTLSVLGAAAGFAGGGPLGALTVPMVVQAMNSPRTGALAGIAMDSFGKGMNAQSMRKAALLARLSATE